MYSASPEITLLATDPSLVTECANFVVCDASNGGWLNASAYSPLEPPSDLTVNAEMLMQWYSSFQPGVTVKQMMFSNAFSMKACDIRFIFKESIDSIVVLLSLAWCTNSLFVSINIHFSYLLPNCPRFLTLFASISMARCILTRCVLTLDTTLVRCWNYWKRIWMWSLFFGNCTWRWRVCGGRKYIDFTIK